MDEVINAEGLPVAEVLEIIPAAPGREWALWRVKCPFGCKRGHVHAEGDGPRVAHCPTSEPRSYYVAKTERPESWREVGRAFMRGYQGGDDERTD